MSRGKTQRPQAHVLCGWIVKGRDEDYSEALYLIDHRPQTDKWSNPMHETFVPLAKRVYALSDLSRKPVSVAYHLTNAPVDEADLAAMIVAKITGVEVNGLVESQYFHRYSELTGYLWTTETFKVGGHDMIAQLSSHLGKWCFLSLKVHEPCSTKP